MTNKPFKEGMLVRINKLCHNPLIKFEDAIIIDARYAQTLNIVKVLSEHPNVNIPGKGRCVGGLFWVSTEAIRPRRNKTLNMRHFIDDDKKMGSERPPF